MIFITLHIFCFRINFTGYGNIDMCSTRHICHVMCFQDSAANKYLEASHQLTPWLCSGTLHFGSLHFPKSHNPPPQSRCQIEYHMTWA